MLSLKLVTTLLLVPLGVVFVRRSATYLLGFIGNRRAARETGIPYVSVPFLDFNVFYGIFARSPLFAPLVDRILPAFLTSWVPYARPDWRFIRKYEVHRELGDLFQVVTPELVVINIADADVIREILTRRNDFTKVQRTLPPVRLYGENVLVAEGQQWRHHRKVVAPPFTERNNHLVWKEAIRQASTMLDTWTTPEPLPAILPSLKTLTINVISHAGFGVSIPFNDTPDGSSVSSTKLTSPTTPGPGHTMTFKTAVELITNDFRITMLTRLLPGWVIRRAPAGLQRIEKAYHEFGDYLRELLQGEKETPSEKENLLSALNRSNEAERGVQGTGLSDEEMIGNVFLFALAGHETTSVALEYVILNLALHPDKQEWLHSRIDEHLVNMPVDPREWNYEMFKTLTGPICVMNETLRMYPPTPVVVRWTGDKSQTLTHNGTTYVLPPKFVTALNFIGLHYNPKYWGEDATVFRPERWEYTGPAAGAMTDVEDSTTDTPPTRFPGVKAPARGTFLPFSDGFRACLGRRFAEVEITAVIAVLFHGHRATLKLLPGENWADAAKRVQVALDKSSNQFTMAVRKDIGIVWEARK